MSRNVIIAIIIVIAAVVTGFVAISSRTPSPSGTSAQIQEVSIKNFTFSPSAMSVKVGTTVGWTNNDNAPHTAVSDPSGSTFNSPTLQSGDTFSFTFNSAGTFPYHCSIHPNMRATITVTP